MASFKKSGTVIIKHANPSGVSINKSPIRSFQESLSCDPISAFGGVVACNFKIDKKIAKKMSLVFFEVILARGFNEEALKILRSKKNLRLIDASKFKYKKNYQIKYFDTSFLLQEKNQKVFDVKKLNITFPDRKTIFGKKLTQFNFERIP